MGQKIIFLATVLAGAALVGCTESTSSANIRTGGIAALIDVTAESATSSTVHVELRVGGSSSNTFVILESGDKLTAEVGGAASPERKGMQAESDGEYAAEFKTGADGTEFKVLFERDVDDDALDNRGTLPAPFEITAVPKDSPSRANDDVTITWDPTDTDVDMKLEVEGSCIFREEIDVAGDSGSHTITKGTLESTSSGKMEACDLEVTMTRTRAGTADKVFDNESWFRLHQVRKATFASKP